MLLTAASYTATGGRNVNEDAVSLSEDGKTVLAIVADGLGGHSCGDVASRLAITSVSASLSGWHISEAALQDAIYRANNEIVRHENGSNMRTTIAVLWVSGNTALAATVGDTRIYHFRDNAVAFRTVDHSIAQAEVESGAMRSEEIRYSVYRHHLTRALGGSERVKPDIVTRDVKPGDAFLVCSDGVWGEVLESEMSKALASSAKPHEWLERIREHVVRRTGDEGDNHSAIALYVHEPGGGR